MLWRRSSSGPPCQYVSRKLLEFLSEVATLPNGFFSCRFHKFVVFVSPALQAPAGITIQRQFDYYGVPEVTSIPPALPELKPRKQASQNRGNFTAFSYDFSLFNSHIPVSGFSNYRSPFSRIQVLDCRRKFSGNSSCGSSVPLNLDGNEVNEISVEHKHSGPLKDKGIENLDVVGGQLVADGVSAEKIQVIKGQNDVVIPRLRHNGTTCDTIVGEKQSDTAECDTKVPAYFSHSDLGNSRIDGMRDTDSNSALRYGGDNLEGFDNATELEELTETERLAAQLVEPQDLDTESAGEDVRNYLLNYSDKEEIRLRSAARRSLRKGPAGESSREVGEYGNDQAEIRGSLPGEFPLVEASDEEKREYQRKAALLSQAIMGGFFNKSSREGYEEEQVDSVDSSEIPEEKQRSLRIGIIGAPNAGKSVLANVLVGSKISAVSRKTNTTRTEILGISTRGDTQLLLYDTPGVAPENTNHPLKAINKRVMSRTWGVMELCEVVILLIDAERQIRMPDRRVERLIRKVGSERMAGQHRVVCLNKVDLIRDKRVLFPLAEQLQEFHAFERVFMLSGLKGSGVTDLEKYLLDSAVLRPWDEDPSRKTTQSQSQLALEIVRECILDRLHQELPYTVDQIPVSQNRLSDGSLRIEQVLLVANETQRALVVGKGGEAVRQIGIAARKQLEEIFQEKVHLILQVKNGRKR